MVKKLNKEHGYGAAVREGYAQATGNFCIFYSCDRVDPIEYLQEFYDLMLQGADIVQCSRYTNKEDTTTIPFIYKFYQFFYRRLVWLLVGTKLEDTTYAFKMFRREQIINLHCRQNTFSISPEITFKVILSNGNIKTIAAPQSTRVFGKSKFRFTKELSQYSYVLLRAFLHRIKVVRWF